MTTPRFEIRKATNGQFYFVLKAANGEIVATSEMYLTPQGARKGITATLDICQAGSVSIVNTYTTAHNA